MSSLDLASDKKILFVKRQDEEGKDLKIAQLLVGEVDNLSIAEMVMSNNMLLMVM